MVSKAYQNYDPIKKGSMLILPVNKPLLEQLIR